MLEIKAIQSKTEQEQICGLCGIAYDADCMAYAAHENNKLLGAVQFRILGGYAVIYDLANACGLGDMPALIIIGKAALNFIDLCGVQDVIIKAGDGLPEALGFARDKHGAWRVNLDGYFDAPCQKRPAPS